ncbi:MAG: hypothetical protein GY909_06225 [Oligoflexia bacterium]|nr:hypothetical protein [Oligoflexia bacterium]
MMEITFTCPECGSGIHVKPSVEATVAQCDVCSHKLPVKFNKDHEQGIVKDCPCCERKDFYKQKDFNRKIGVVLFVIAAILSIWTYGISFIVLYLFDLILYKILGDVVACYKCNTLFRKVSNISEIHGFDHEMNDRIVYSDHDFQGQAPTH